MTTTTDTTAAPDRMVNGVDFVMLPVADLERARTFYAEVLGLEASNVWQREGHPAVGAEFETGTVTLALMDVAAVGGEFKAGSGAVALRVDDVAATRERLVAQGVTFIVDEMDSGVCHQAVFRDSEGNSLILHHRYAPRG
ncbi:MAG: Glyoxalase/bleomycin resistance protein/dioxygenase [Thermoleophilia bacterium]|nr:Glyoxalase/bleomycin resistance protein/dioxygenase [Thermoleophilia bacterium]